MSGPGSVQHFRQLLAAMPLKQPGPSSPGRAYYEYLVTRYSDLYGITRRGTKSDPIFKHWYKTLQQQQNSKKPDRSPSGPYARALEVFGYRDPRATWNVGETPKVRDVSSMFAA